MKKTIANTGVEAEHFGLLANARSGSWSIDIDESIEGAERWFAQIDGPNVYMNFEIARLEIVDEIASFLRWHMCPDSRRQQSTLPAREDIVLGHFDGTAVTLIWDSETNERCFFLISAKAELVVRLCLERGEIEDLTKAFEQVRDELRTEGLLPPISK